ncbi:superoxide dismutase[Cu-Zn] [Mycobacterium sp.]|uniref:superoxide dismutase[Cu-Zn] n=1 Tax=Mycobacterium sp. TaxID=1785 RepID=UPI003A881E15
MPTPAGRSPVTITVSALSAVACVALVSACSSPQKPADTPGTTPAIWTGSPAPSGSGDAEGTSGGEGIPAADGSLTTVLKGAGGTEVATAKFDFSKGYATVTLSTVTAGVLAPGFHGVHVHKVGKCEPNSVAPTGGGQGDFMSAGGHFSLPGDTGPTTSGNLTSLQVRADGSGTLVTTTDAVTADDLTEGSGTAIIIHERSDNFGNIPFRYQTSGRPGPDETTTATGDAGKRVACGVIGSG